MDRVVKLMFGNRVLILVIFAVLTLFMGYNALKLRVDSGFIKLLPEHHPYIETLLHYQNDFGTGNQIIVALIQKDGTIFNSEFFTAMKLANDEVFFLPGVARSTVTSIFTPNVRFIEVVEDGFSGGNVVPAEFRPTDEWMPIVRNNIIKSGRLGNLVANDFSGALIRAELIDRDPGTRRPLDYQRVAQDLERNIRAKFESDKIDVRIIGFAKSTGDIAEGARGVIGFFGITLVITALLLWWYSGSIWLTVLPLVAATTAVVGLLGSLPLLGYGLDPMTIVVPFLVFAIGVSHGVQMVSGWMGEVMYGGDTDAHGQPLVPAAATPRGVDSMGAAQRTFRRLLAPGALAVIANVAGFATLLLIDVGIVQETAITASIGMAIMLFTKMILLPVMLSFVQLRDLAAYRDRHRAAETKRDWLWRLAGKLTHTGPSLAVLALALIVGAWGIYKSGDMKIGDLHAGVPELREDARYNLDSRAIASKFSIGVDKLSVIVEAPANACVDYDVMKELDRFVWYARNLPGVQSVDSLANAMKTIIAANNEGSPRWYDLSRNTFSMSSTLYHMGGGGKELMNAACDAMPVHIYTVDHKATTIDNIIAGIKTFESSLPPEKFKLRLAAGNVGIIAATNQTVKAAEIPMMLWVYVAVTALSLLTFRSIGGTLCIIIPLALVSVLCNALMAVLDIGLKVNTLPVVALGVGVGVDYAIYIYHSMSGFLKGGDTLADAYYKAMRLTGKAVIFIGLSLAVGVCTWIFAPLKFQADMGILLTFLFVTNMLGAIIIFPALARWLLRSKVDASAGAATAPV